MPKPYYKASQTYESHLYILKQCLYGNVFRDTNGYVHLASTVVVRSSNQSMVCSDIDL
jgi:hypothetical protein